MPLLSIEVLRLVDTIAIVLSQAYQLARIRLASAASPVLRLLMQRDHAQGESELLQRELTIRRSQRTFMPPHRRPDYQPAQRLAILQLCRIRGWTIRKTAARFVLHPNTIRSWMKAVDGRGNVGLLTEAIIWNRLDEMVRWTSHELRRLCPEPELGTRAIARHLVRGGLAISRSTVQRILREDKPTRSPRRRRPPMAQALDITPHHLLVTRQVNHVWHIDLTSLRILWFRRFVLAAILDGFSRRILRVRVYARTPRQRDLASLVRHATGEFGKPRFIITDHGTQFRGRFRAALSRMRIRHVKGRVRAPYLNGKVERLFRTFRLWWRLVLTGLTRSGIQRRLDDYQHWYNHHRPHSALGGRTPDEAWNGIAPSEPISIRQRDAVKPRAIDVRRLRCRGDPRLPVIEISIRYAA